MSAREERHHIRVGPDPECQRCRQYEDSDGESWTPEDYYQQWDDGDEESSDALDYRTEVSLDELEGESVDDEQFGEWDSGYESWVGHLEDLIEEASEPENELDSASDD